VQITPLGGMVAAVDPTSTGAHLTIDHTYWYTPYPIIHLPIIYYTRSHYPSSHTFSSPPSHTPFH
jgi:hypothetical protein